MIFLSNNYESYNDAVSQMLAKEVLEESLLTSLTQKVPNVEIDGAPTSEKAITDFTMKK